MGGARRILFRADAGLEIGTGHVMRCLTLADALRAEGAEAVLVTREHRGHVIPAITRRGHQVITLPSNPCQPYGAHPAPPHHACWLEADWRTDAATTRAALEETSARWLVMDHYALEARWQDAAMPPGVSLLVIDDLADRPHRADMLLDQNSGREAADYAGLLPAGCDLRIGPAHALLRPEFAHLRPRALARREALARPESLLITLGGIDKDNATGIVLDAVARAPAAQGLWITVVMGSSAPHLDTVRARATTMPMPTEVAVDIPDMAQRMMMADLCIGAVGSTAWERCALGLPTLQVVLADNQVDAARAMAARSLSLALPIPDAPEFATALAAGLDQLSGADAYRAMARAAAALTDGGGAERLAACLLDSEKFHA